jgi:hypothetical protein
MPKRCASASCNAPVSEKKPFVRVDDKVFCHSACLSEYKTHSDLLTMPAEGGPTYCSPYRRPPWGVSGF